MTAEELRDIAAIARAVTRLEAVVTGQDARLARLERFAARAEGGMAVIKLGISLLGIGGVATILALFSRGTL